MPSHPLLPALAAIALALSGCTYFGGVNRSVQAREALTIAGRACELREIRHEALSINGTHAWIETRVACGGRTIDCEHDTRDQCLARVRTALAARS